jgi:hypothetical protein
MSSSGFCYPQGTGDIQSIPPWCDEIPNVLSTTVCRTRQGSIGSPSLTPPQITKASCTLTTDSKCVNGECPWGYHLDSFGACTNGDCPVGQYDAFPTYAGSQCQSIPSPPSSSYLPNSLPPSTLNQCAYLPNSHWGATSCICDTSFTMVAGKCVLSTSVSSVAGSTPSGVGGNYVIDPSTGLGVPSTGSTGSGSPSSGSGSSGGSTGVSVTPSPDCVANPTAEGCSSTGSGINCATNPTAAGCFGTPINCALNPTNPACTTFGACDNPLSLNCLLAGTTNMPDILTPLTSQSTGFQSNLNTIQNDNSFLGGAPVALAQLKTSFVPAGSCSAFPDTSSDTTKNLLHPFCKAWDDDGGRAALGWYFALLTAMAIFSIWSNSAKDFN